MPLLLTAKWLALAGRAVNAACVLLAGGDHAGPTNVNVLPPRFPDRFFDERGRECDRRFVTMV
jgi:hypothetical protein